MTPEEVSVCVDELMASPKLRAKIQKTYEQVDRAYRESLRTGLTVQLEPIFAGAPYPVDPVGEYLKTSAALRQAGFGAQPEAAGDSNVTASFDICTERTVVFHHPDGSTRTYKYNVSAGDPVYYVGKVDDPNNFSPDGVSVEQAPTPDRPETWRDRSPLL